MIDKTLVQYQRTAQWYRFNLLVVEKSKGTRHESTLRQLARKRRSPMRCSIHWIVVVALAVNLMGVRMVFAQGIPGAGSMPGKAGTAAEQGKAGMGSVPGKAGTAAEQGKAALVNINTDDEAKLTSLKGIGPAKAKAITQYRQEHGPFKTVDDLKNVSGIGDKTLAALRPFITVGP
jgi:comEA protein